ncbi:hypothetical protein PI126_g21165 [Phytophthora idaei]|nr:hypothetical protein PI126_g21165 [Phytophthora idaei]
MRGPAKRTLSRSASKSNRYGYLYDAAAEAELGGGNGEDDEPRYRGDPGDFGKDYIRHLSFDKADEDTKQYLEVRSHASLNKIAKFDGKRYRSDAALQWLKRIKVDALSPAETIAGMDVGMTAETDAEMTTRTANKKAEIVE